MSKEFHEALTDDFNTPEALGVLHRLIKLLEKQFNTNTVSRGSVRYMLNKIRQGAETLGLDIFSFLQGLCIPAEVTHLAQEREAARLRKDWKESDRLRAEISARGYVVEDTACRGRGLRSERRAHSHGPDEKATVIRIYLRPSADPVSAQGRAAANCIKSGCKTVLQARWCMKFFSWPRAKGIPVEWVRQREQLDQRVQGNHQGMIAQASAAAFHDLDGFLAQMPPRAPALRCGAR